MKNRILIGNSMSGDISVFMDILYPKTNSHTLILGESGAGKTYFTQVLLREMIGCQYRCFVLDLAGSLARGQAEKWFFEEMREEVNYINVAEKGTGINLFKRIQLDEEILEKISGLSSRLVDTLSFYLGKGEVQRSLLYQAIKKIVERAEKKGISASLADLMNELNNDMDNVEIAKKIALKLAPLVDGAYFDTDINSVYESEKNLMIWEMQSVSLQIKRVISDIILWQLWGEAVVSGSKENPIFVFIDEFQNINLIPNSPTYKILCEGRKYGLNLLLATQFFRGKFSPEVEMAVAQMGNKVCFKPPEREAKLIAEILGSYEDRKKAEKELMELKRGEAKVLGNFYLGKETLNPMKKVNKVKIKTI